MRTSTGLKPKTKKRTVRKEPRKMAKRAPDREPAPPEEPTYEPEDDGQIDPSEVIVDVNLARQPRSDNAKSVAEQAKGDEQIEQVKNRRAGSGGVFEINPYDLYLEDGWNVRNFETAARKAYIAELAASIGAIGVKETLLAHIKDNKIVVHSGWNRLLATYHAIENGTPVMAIPVRFGKASENEADRTLSQLVNNGVRSDLTLYEKGLAIKRMINFGWSEQQIATSIGKSVTNVKGLLDLQGLPMSLQELVASGVVSPYYATKAYRLADDNEEATLRELNSAIENARASGAKRVMPKHGENAPARQRRANGGGGSGGSGRRGSGTRGGGGGRSTRMIEAPAAPSVAADIPRIVALIQAARWERDEEAGVALLSFAIADFDELATLANLPEDIDTGIEPVGDVTEDEKQFDVDEDEEGEVETVEPDGESVGGTVRDADDDEHSE